MSLLNPDIGAMTRGRLWIIPMLVGALVTIAIFGARLSKPAIIEDLSLLFSDIHMRQAPRLYDPDIPVRIIDIDDESIKRIGQWPWPRTVLAEMNDRLTNAEVAVIAYDVIFSEADRTSPENMIEVLKSNPAAAQSDFQGISDLKSHDTIYAESFERTRVVLGMFLLGNETDTIAPPKSGFSFSGASPAESLEAYRGLNVAIPELYDAALGSGSVSFQPDGDGIVRTAPLLGRVGEKIYPSLAMEALRVAQDASSYIIKSSDASNEWGAGSGGSPDMAALRVGNFEIPTTKDGKLLMYYTQPTNERLIPAWKILSDNPADRDWENQLPGNIIFVGTSSEGLKDIVTTPFRGGEPGVLVHAQVVEQVLQGEYIHKPYWIDVIELFGILFLGTLMTIVLPRLSAARGVILILFFGNAIYWTSYLAFTRYNYVIDAVYPLLSIILIYILITLTSFYLTESERSRIRGAFSLYLSPEMVKQVSENPDLLKLGGEEREISVLFLDIRSFSQISETMRPQDITVFLNKFLTPMTDILQSHEATIDKYIGDAIVAFWNAPVDDPEHEKNSARAVLEMQKELADLNARYRNQSEFRWPDTVKIGVGVNTGVCCVGNLGSEQRFSYSMIGDAANLASRIEGLTKQYRVSSLFGTATAKALTGFALLEADIVSVVGRQTPETIYLLAGDENVTSTAEFKQYKEIHNKFLIHYRAQEWGAAKVMIAQLMKLASPYNLEGYYQTFNQRIETFEVTPPPSDWQGIHIAENK